MSKQFKNGAASFYIVAFSTLVLMVIAASFAAIIISEVTRTSNDDLAQSAYDSALAGVEDAKLAYYNFQGCEKTPSAGGCSEIIDMIEHPRCDMVGLMLGRAGEGEEVQIQETDSSNNNMQQAYTCVKIETRLDDYKATLSGNNQTKVVRVKFDEDTNGDGLIDENDVDVASAIDKVVVKWYSDANGTEYKYNNFDTGNNSVAFPKILGDEAGTDNSILAYAEPPTLSVAMVQTTEEFSLDSFDMTQNGRTNRGMVYMVPVGNEMSVGEYNKVRDSRNYISAYNGTSADGIVNNIITNGATYCTKDDCTEFEWINGGMLKSNDKTKENLPYAVYCPQDGGFDYACSATIELPRPVGSDKRNSDTFVFAVSIPYGQPTTDFELSFHCADGTLCSYEIDEEGTVTEQTELAKLDGVQIKIDSTGRANDLFRRVETRLEAADDFSLSSLGPLELLGDGGTLLDKNYTVTCEYDFNPTCSR